MTTCDDLAAAVTKALGPVRCDVMPDDRLRVSLPTVGLNAHARRVWVHRTGKALYVSDDGETSWELVTRGVDIATGRAADYVAASSRCGVESRDGVFLRRVDPDEDLGAVLLDFAAVITDIESLHVLGRPTRPREVLNQVVAALKSRSVQCERDVVVKGAARIPRRFHVRAGGHKPSLIRAVGSHDLSRLWAVSELLMFHAEDIRQEWSDRFSFHLVYDDDKLHLPTDLRNEFRKHVVEPVGASSINDLVDRLAA